MKIRILLSLFILISIKSMAQPINFATGSDHCLLVCADSNLISWGSNLNGVLGDGSTGGFNSTPGQLQSISGVKIVKGMYNFSMAITGKGQLYMWGKNQGQFGNGNKNSSATPELITTISDLVSVSGGNAHALFLKKDGSLWGAGQSIFGQLSDSSLNQTYILPVKAKGIGKVRAIAASSDFSLALAEDSTLWACGRGSDGCLGLGDLSNYTMYKKIPSLKGIIKIDAFINICVALDAKGKVYVWGKTNGGGLGNGTDGNSPVPVIANIDNVTDIAAGGSHVFALKNDGTLWSWGYNPYGQLGNGSTTASNIPVQILGLDNQVAKVSGMANGGMAQKKDGSLWVWGLNLKGQFGNGTTVSSSLPIQLEINTSNCLQDVGIERIVKNAFTTFPNPSTGNLQLDFDNNISGYSNLEIFNSSGSRLYSLPIHSGVKNLNLNLSIYPKGFYLIKLITEGNEFTRKIILE